MKVQAIDGKPLSAGGKLLKANASGGTAIDLGVTGAAVGDIIKVAAVDADGKPTAWEAADLASGDEWTLLGEQTLEEAVQFIAAQLPSPTKHFIIQVWSPKTDAESDPTYLNLGINGSFNNLWYYLNTNMPSKNGATQTTIEAQSLGNGSWAISAYANLGSNYGLAQSYNIKIAIPIAIKNNDINVAESVKVGVVAGDATQYFPIGSVFRVWGKSEVEASV